MTYLSVDNDILDAAIFVLWIVLVAVVIAAGSGLRDVGDDEVTEQGHRRSFGDGA